MRASDSSSPYSEAKPAGWHNKSVWTRALCSKRPDDPLTVEDVQADVWFVIGADRVP